MKPNLKIIKDACIKANPNILKLEFGCFVQDKATEEILPVAMPHSWARGVAVVMTKNELIHWEGDDYRILGRPIRLADVLFTLSQIGNVTRGANYLVNIVQSGDDVWIDVRWNLRDDILDHQSPETIQFLAELLK